MGKTGADTIQGTSDTRPPKKQAPSVVGDLNQQTATVQKLAKDYLRQGGTVYAENAVKRSSRPMPESVKRMLSARRK